MTSATQAQALVYTDFSGLTALRAQAQRDPKAALAEAARQFEAYFIQQLLKAARDAGMGGGLLDGEQSGFYQELYHQQLAIALARTGRFGIARILEQQVGAGIPQPGSTAPVVPSPAGVPSAVQRARMGHGAGPGLETRSSEVTGGRGEARPEETNPAFASPADFVTRLWPHARRAAARIGVDPRVLIAQAALETGWGRALPRTPEGRSSHNLFGIKAHGAWRGPVAPARSLEFEGGAMVARRAAFRVYESYAESFDDYAAFLQHNPRYARALQEAADPERFVRALQRAGYATDPNYAEKVLGILRMEEVQAPLTQDRLALADTGG
ncbi:MAG TPA: flagellar assembly peptidoglycan hydrolase FlgJ [Chromatiales bacterium]|nr:flagellar assembly peptidoglycan hydrolase FlgJ [Chromatiales bacterium]